MELRFDASGEVTILAGTLSHGQGHETTYAQMANSSEFIALLETLVIVIDEETPSRALGRVRCERNGESHCQLQIGGIIRRQPFRACEVEQ
jgi:hypothetical protein